MTDKPDIRMVGMDFDWTLYSHREGSSGVPEHTRDMLCWLREHEVEVGIVSGRPWWDMRDLLVPQGFAWGDPFPSYIVARETFIYWIGDDAMEPDEAWNSARADELAELTRQLSERQTAWRLKLESAGLTPVRWFLWGDYGLEIHLPDPERAEQARLLLAEWSADLPLATTSRNRTLAHIILATATKGGSMAHAAASRGLRADQALAIGDSANDITMLDGRHGLRAATVSNADEEIKAAVRRCGGVIAESEAGEGVWELLSNARTRGWFR